MSELKPSNTEPAADRARADREDLSRPRVLDYFRDIRDFLHPASLRERFTRDNLSNFLKTFAWVAPLTILIWVWAEREQLDELTGQTVPIQLRLSGTDKVARIINPPDRNVMVTLRGPRGQLEAIQRELSQRAVEQRVELDLDPQTDPNPRAPRSLSLQPLLQESEFFRRYGVSISDVRPSEIVFAVSQLVSINVPVQNPPGAAFANIGTETVYQPTSVRVTARQEDVEGHEQVGSGFFVYPDLTRTDIDLSKPGTYEVKGVPLLASSAFQGKALAIQPPTVDATLVVRQPNATYTMTMTVFLSHPKDLLDDYVIDYDPTLARVTLVGKPETIAAIERNELKGPRGTPRAVLEILPGDLPPAPQPRSKVVDFILPEGVSVAEDQRARQVSFTIRPRTGE